MFGASYFGQEYLAQYYPVIQIQITGTGETTSSGEKASGEGLVPIALRGGASYTQPITGHAETHQIAEQSRSKGNTSPQIAIFGRGRTQNNFYQTIAEGYIDESDEEILKMILQLVED